MSWLVVWFGVGREVSALGPGQRNDVGNLQVAEVAAGILRDLFHGLVKICIFWIREVGANQEFAERDRFLFGLPQLSSEQDSGLFGDVGGRLKSEGIVVDELLLEACALMLEVQHQYLSRAPVWGLKIVLGSRRAVTESVRLAKVAGVGSTPCGQDGHQIVELHSAISVDIAFIA